MIENFYRRFETLDRLNDEIFIVENFSERRKRFRKPIIIGTAVGSAKDVLEPFVNSLKPFMNDLDVLLFSSNLSAETELYLSENRINTYFFDPQLYPGIHIQNSRWLIYLDYLLDRLWNRDLPEAVFFTDVYDVIFQRNPFEIQSKRVEYFEEDERVLLGNQHHNQMWIKSIFGDEILNELATKRISCSGTVMAQPTGAIEYLLKMRELTLGLAPDVAAIALDQGPHNFIVHRNMIRDAVLVKNGGRVLTLGIVHDSRVHLTTGNLIANYECNISPVVHQYNRHPKLIESVRQKYVLRT